MNRASLHPYDRLTPDVIIAAVEALGRVSDRRILALNSYENRVYQVGIEQAAPLVVKFYRPDRWTDAAIQEEHGFALELAAAEVPVVPPLVHDGRTLFEYERFRYALFERRGGRWPELGTRTEREWMGRFLGRIHMTGRRQRFRHRGRIDVERMGDESRNFLLGEGWIPAHLETAYLGTLARRTLIATNVARVLEVANGKPIIFMPARHDHHRVQTGDGYAAYVAGAMLGAEIGVTSDAQASWWGGRGVGTVPHALIASYGGNTVLAATKFADWAPADFRITVLVDFENDSVRTALDVARALGPRLWGVRLDTSSQLVDRSLWGELGDFDPRGVNERLVTNVRAALDADGFERVRIVASGGFTAAKIRQFEDLNVPADIYGVGSWLLNSCDEHGTANDFTADVVMTDGRPSAKVGRSYRPNPRLELVT